MPVLSMASLDGAVIGANDDGGGARNSRIEQYLPAGVYFLEATTYLTRDLQPLDADFTLTVRLVDELAQQQSFQIKVEKVAPARRSGPRGIRSTVQLPGGQRRRRRPARRWQLHLHLRRGTRPGRAPCHRRQCVPIFQRWPGGVSFHSDAESWRARPVWRTLACDAARGHFRHIGIGLAVRRHLPPRTPTRTNSASTVSGTT